MVAKAPNLADSPATLDRDAHVARRVSLTSCRGSFKSELWTSRGPSGRFAYGAPLAARSEIDLSKP